MSEDLKIQQQPSALPYVAGGAVVGGLGGWGATKIDAVKKYVTEAPKYSSAGDIVKEMESKDKFETLTKEAPEEQKDFWEKAKAEQAKIEKVAADYDNELNEYIKNNQKVTKVVDTDEIKQLEKDLNELKTKVANDEKALNDAKPVNNVTKKMTNLELISKDIELKETEVHGKETVAKLKDDISDLTEKLELAKNKEYLEQRQKGLQVEIENLTSEIEKLTTKLDSNPNAADLTKFENLAKDLERKSKELVDLNAQKKSRAISIPKANISSDYPRLVKDMQKNEALLEEIAEQRKDIIQRLAKDPNSAELQKELSNLAKKEEGIKKAFEELKAKVYNPENLTKEMQEKLAKYNAQEKFINEKLDDYARRASQASKKEGGTERSINQGLAQLRDDIFGVKGKDGKVVKEGLVGLSNSEKEAVFNQAKEQFNDRIALFDRIHKDELKLASLKREYENYTPSRRKYFDEHLETIKRDITKEKGEIENLKRIKTLITNMEKHEQKMAEASKFVPEIMKKNEFNQLVTADHAKLKELTGLTVEDLKNGKQFKPVSFYETISAEEGKVLKTYIEKLSQQKPNPAPVVENPLKATIEADKAKITELTSQIAEKRGNLPKEEITKTAEELTKEFEKSKGAKKDILENARKNATEALKEDFSKLFSTEGKISNKKLAMAIGGVAAVGALLGLAFVPKSKEC